MSDALFKDRRVLWMPFEVSWQRPPAGMTTCCSAMAAALDFTCTEHEDPFACADGLMVYNDVFGEYGLPVHDGGASYVVIAHCPWCGAALGDSQRDRWFDETDRYDQAGEPIPEKFLSGAWRRIAD